MNVFMAILAAMHCCGCGDDERPQTTAARYFATKLISNDLMEDGDSIAARCADEEMPLSNDLMEDGDSIAARCADEEMPLVVVPAPVSRRPVARITRDRRRAAVLSPVVSDDVIQDISNYVASECADEEMTALSPTGRTVPPLPCKASGLPTVRSTASADDPVFTPVPVAAASVPMLPAERLPLPLASRGAAGASSGSMRCSPSSSFVHVSQESDVQPEAQANFTLMASAAVAKSSSFDSDDFFAHGKFESCWDDCASEADLPPDGGPAS